MELWWEHIREGDPGYLYSHPHASGRVYRRSLCQILILPGSLSGLPGPHGGGWMGRAKADPT